jgi:acetyl-CoA carboxylase biotin carboxyl carrier protein
LNPKELKAVLQSLQEHEVSELTLETPDYKLTVKRGSVAHTVVAQPILPIAHQAVPQAAAPAPAMALPQATVSVAPAAPAAPASAEDPGKLAEVKAPIVGTFYRSPAPDQPAFVQEGDTVKKGQVLCIIEAMKLMNEIESEVAGVVKKIAVGNGEPVEYGQVLFLIEPV